MEITAYSDKTRNKLLSAWKEIKSLHHTTVINGNTTQNKNEAKLPKVYYILRPGNGQ